jgi:hypothetical protein
MTPKPKTPEWPKVVRVTMKPDEDLTVTQQQYTELSVQGLLVPETEKESAT